MAQLGNLLVTGAARFINTIKGTVENAETVNNHTVETDVPSGAKFTDTNTYTSAYCGTATGTAGKSASMTYFTLTANNYTHINFRYANTAQSALTLNINSTGAKPLYINGTASSSTNYTLPAGSYLVFYDGTNYYLRTDGLLTGVTATAGTNNNTLATTEFVQQAIAAALANL